MAELLKAVVKLLDDDRYLIMKYGICWRCRGPRCAFRYYRPELGHAIGLACLRAPEHGPDEVPPEATPIG
jgi:hypothetical protein